MSSLRRDAGPNDEIIVIGDGKQLGASHLADDPDPRIRYFEVPGGFCGCPQRDAAISMAKGDFLMFADDDDDYLPGAIPNIVRPALSRNTSRPHIFRIPFVRATVPPQSDTIGGAMFVPPNNPLKLARWDRRELDATRGAFCDWHFISDVLSHYSDPPILINRCIYLVRPGTPWAANQLLQYHGMAGDFNGFASLELPGRYDRMNALLDQFNQEVTDEAQIAARRAEARELVRNRL